jgi:Protein of unknown function (DUF2924)
MPRVRIGSSLPNRQQVDVEVTRLRDLDVSELRNRWHAVLGRAAPTHLPRHLLFRILAYRMQADHLGDLDSESQRLPAKSGQYVQSEEISISRRVCGGPGRTRTVNTGDTVRAIT